VRTDIKHLGSWNQELEIKESLYFLFLGGRPTEVFPGLGILGYLSPAKHGSGRAKLSKLVKEWK